MLICVSQVLHDKALEEPEAPIQGCMVPPSYGRLVQMIDIAFPGGQQGGSRSTAQSHELYQAAAAAQWISKYNQEKNIPGKVSCLQLYHLITLNFGHKNAGCECCPQCCLGSMCIKLLLAVLSIARR